MNEDEPTYSVVRIAEGQNRGIPVLLIAVTDEDVAEARECVRAGDLASLPVLAVVVSFLHALDINPAEHDWTPAEYIALLGLLGMPPGEWSPDDDLELTQLLVEAVKQHG